VSTGIRNEKGKESYSRDQIHGSRYREYKEILLLRDKGIDPQVKIDSSRRALTYSTGNRFIHRSISVLEVYLSFLLLCHHPTTDDGHEEERKERRFLWRHRFLMVGATDIFFRRNTRIPD